MSDQPLIIECAGGCGRSVMIDHMPPSKTSGLQPKVNGFFRYAGKLYCPKCNPVGSASTLEEFSHSDYPAETGDPALSVGRVATPAQPLIADRTERTVM